MKTTNDFLNDIRTKYGLHSDWGIFKLSGIKPTALSSYRTKRSYFDDKTAIKVATLLDINPAIVISAAHAERAKDEQEKAVWKDIFERLGGLAASVLLVFALTIPANDVQAMPLAGSPECILC